MIATIRSGIGSLVDQWFRGSRVRMGLMVINDQQGCRDQLRPLGFADDSPGTGAHADIAMRRFMAHTLDVGLGDLRNDATPSELVALEPATRVLGDL